MRGPMRGRLIKKTWQYNPTLPAPARYRRACQFEAFIPAPLTGLTLSLPGDVGTLVSEAETAITKLNGQYNAALVCCATSAHARVRASTCCDQGFQRTLSSPKTLLGRCSKILIPTVLRCSQDSFDAKGSRARLSDSRVL